MKSETDSPQPTPPAQPTAAATTVLTTTPAATPYAATQWSPPTHIPIDPALQQQSATPTQYYQSYYPQAAYAPQYHSYAPPTTAQPAVTTTPIQPATVARPATQQASNSGVDTADIATLNDALGSAGVDLRAEEETLQRSHEQHHTYRTYEDRTRKQPATPSFDVHFLGQTMRTLATTHKVTKIPDDSINYLALALRARLQDLVVSMAAAARHRTDTQFDRPASLYEDGSPMWGIVVRSDVAKQLAAIERVERDEELRIRRERKERAELAIAHAATLAAQAAGAGAMAVDGLDEDGAPGKKKRKKEGPGVTARNMSEDVRKKMSNAVASQAAGFGGKYAWMNAANSGATPAKSKAAAAASSSNANSTPATTTTPATTASGGSGWARPYVSSKKVAAATPTQPVEEDTRTSITLRDAMFVIEKERGHGGGRGAAKALI
ncbi:hypothetical protein HGRIS_010333 [Hohenbuehelia grisea]|uniref:Transcription initiation factor TFIID subunit 4 n=1 Tax=Hohenbuehelia grisea TaxID=104357 RepID=A0ABR3J474_9AGAR